MKYSFSDIIIFTGISVGLLSFSVGLIVISKFLYKVWKYIDKLFT